MHDDETFPFNDPERDQALLAIVRPIVHLGQDRAFEYLGGIENIDAVLLHDLLSFVLIPFEFQFMVLKLIP